MSSGIVEFEVGSLCDFCLFVCLAVCLSEYRHKSVFHEKSANLQLSVPGYGSQNDI